MKLFIPNFETSLLRYYLMMFIVVFSFFIGYPAFAILAVPVFLSALMGIEFKSKTKPVEKEMDIEVSQKEKERGVIESHFYTQKAS